MIKSVAAKVRAGWLLACLIYSGLTSLGGELPERVLPAGVGVNIHFIRGHERDLDLIAAAGFKVIRIDYFWSDIEKQKGIYDWSAYDELMTNLERRGLRGLCILCYSNRRYEKTGVPPQHPESVAAFARWAAAGAKHFQGRAIIWEIWNEPNYDGFWKPKPDVQQYITLALATAKAVRAADPQATIIGPATSEFPWPFLETFLQSGVLEYLDGISVHPYRQPATPPETAARDFARLRLLIDSNTPPSVHRTIPIISSEWGYSTFTKGVSPDKQAAFIARQQLSNLLNGVPISIWYDWINDGTDPREKEHNFGTVASDLAAKPAYTAIKTLTHELAGFAIQRRDPLEDTNDYVLVLANAVTKQTKLAVWTMREPHSVTLPLDPAAAKTISTVDGAGQTGKIEIQNGQIVLPLNDAPQYIGLGEAKLR